MPDFIVKYWVEFLFGLLATGAGFLLKHLFAIIKKEKLAAQREFYKDLNKRFEENSTKTDEELQSQINSIVDTMKCLKAGLLSVQGRNFKESCRALLDQEHEMTLQEYEQITKDYHAYKDLGGNSDGDTLYALIEAKEKSNI